MTTQTTPLPFKSVTYAGTGDGPRLIVLGAVHGNETCGTQAVLRTMEDLDAGRLALAAGSVTFVPVTNPLAYAKGERAGDRNLNRNLAPTATPQDFEDRVANWLCPLLMRHDILLDLHSTRAKNAPFCMLGPFDNDGALQPFRQAARERALALRLGVARFVDGWLETYAKGVERRVRQFGITGTRANALNTDPKYGVGTTEFMRAMGGCAVTLECGQHDDPQAPGVAYRAIANALAHLGLTGAPDPAPVVDFEYLSLHEVTDRVHADDAFSREWSSFDRLAKGDLIGTRADGTRLVAEADGTIMFPDFKALPGNEWFYLARPRPPGELLPAG